PVWVQSVEKYADALPRQLLARVAEGNDPANFVFCLSKVDHVAAQGGERGVAELRDDFASRVGAALKLPAPPRVYAVSSVRGESFDLPALRAALSRGRTSESLTSSRQLAVARQ